VSTKARLRRMFGHKTRKPTAKRAATMRKAFTQQFRHLGKSLTATIAWTAWQAGARWALTTRRRP
jgi:hypothetical protein